VAFWDDLTRDEVSEEYPGFEMDSGTKTVRRFDYWDSSKEIVFLGGNVYDAVPNELHHPPFVIQLCQQGTFLDTSQRALMMRGESLFSANRELYPELNRIASIMQTQNMLTLAPPQKLTSRSGKKLPDAPIYRAGRIVALQAGDPSSGAETLEKIEAPDIQASTRFFQALLDGALQRGSISHIDWGNLQFQLSQVAIATLAGASRQVFTPRMKTMERFKRLAYKEAAWQFVYFGLTADIGRKGKSIYTAADLAGNYTVDFEYVTALPEETAAAYGLADMAQRWMDDRSIRKTILKYRDYDDIDEKYMVQQARRTSRALAFWQMAESMEKQGLKDEAKMLLIEAGMALQGKDGREQIVVGEGGEAQPQASSATAALARGGGTSNQRVTRKSESPGSGELEKEEAASGV
jgi:hypothetical protein